MKSGKTLALRIAALGMGASIAAAAAAAITLPKEGNYDAIACWSGVATSIAHSKTHTADSYEMTGTVVSKIPGGLGDNNSFRCVGMNTSFNGKRGGGNVCEAVDADGDKRLSQFWIEPDGKVTRQTVSGTGKYEGLTMATTVMPMGPFPEVKAGAFQGCNHQTGTYKLK